MANIIDALISRFRSDQKTEAPKKRGYEAAQSGRLNANWRGSNATNDAVISMGGAKLRARSRDMVRNNPLAEKIVSTHARYFIGSGIVPRAKTGNPEMDERINNLFQKWTSECDVQGRMDFYGLCWMEAEMMVQDGEAFVRRRWRRPTDGLTVPLQLEVLTSEFCDWHRNGQLERNNIVNGIEYDQIGRRRGYWMHNQDPRSSTILLQNGLTSSFVRADDVIHIFNPKTSSSRGVPWMAPVMQELRDLRDYQVAEGARKKAEACIVGVLTPPEGDDDPNVSVFEDGNGTERYMTDANGNPVERMEPGMFYVAHDGSSIAFNTPAASAGAEAYIRTMTRIVASGVNMPYELLTGDYSQANFASGKLGLMDYKRFVGSVQRNIFIHQALRRKWQWFIEAAKLGGQIPMDLEVDVAWQAPEFESIDRLDEARADLADVRMGKRSPQEIIAKTGRNPKTVLEEIDEWFSSVDDTDSGLVFDSDPRKVSSVGQAHQVQKAQKTGDERGSTKPGKGKPPPGKLSVPTKDS